MSESKKVTLFKTRKQVLQLPAKGWGIVAFRRQRFATMDKDLEKYIKDVLIKDPAYGIYVDPAEPTVDLDTHMNTVGIRKEEIQQYVYEKQIAMKLPDSTYGDAPRIAGISGSTDSPVTGGASGTSRFTAAEIAAARTAAAKAEGK